MYRVTAGRSRPISFSKAATVSGVADWPSIARAKSPGSISTAEKMMIDTKNNVTRPSPRRWRTVLTTGCMIDPSAACSILRFDDLGKSAASPPAENRTRRRKERSAGHGATVRSGEPPARGDLHAVDVPVGGDVAMRQLLGVGRHIGAPAEIDQAAIVMHELLHLGIHALALVAVGLGAGLDQELVEPRIGPEGVVPGGSLGIGDREHQVLDRPAVPIGSDERLLQPNHVPVAVGRLAHDLDIDIGGRGMRR